MRIAQILFPLCLLAAAALAPSLTALDTPLVIRSPDGRLTGVVSPTQGTMQIYEIAGERLTKRASANWRADLQFLETVPPTKEHLDWTRLRLGSPAVNRPNYAQFFDEVYPELDRRRRPGRDDDELLPFKERAWNTEETFWADPPDYDGKISAAMISSGGQNAAVMIVVPSLYTILMYWVEGYNIRFMGSRNYRTDLYIPQVWNSFPTPQQILEALPADIQADHREQVENQIENLGEMAGEVLPISPSEVWVTSVRRNNTDVFVLLDHANNRLMTYTFQFGGRAGGILSLKGVRNTQVDLLIPSSYKSDPPIAGIVQQHNRNLDKLGMPPVTPTILRKLAQLRSVEAQESSDIQANTDREGRIFLDFPKSRKLMIYDPFGRGDFLELESMRDYTLEVGIGIQMKEARFRALSFQMLEEANDIASRKRTEDVKKLLKTALEWNPHLYEALEGREGRKATRYLKDDAEFQAMMEEAATEAKRLEDEWEALVKAAEEEDRRREELRRQNR